MLAKSFGCAIVGINGYLVEVEVHIVKGLPALNLVGLPDTSLKEARERVRSGIINAGFDFPKKRITVNLAPAELRKEGSGFDLTIALGILAASDYVDIEMLRRYVCFGELSLYGHNRRVDGSLLVAELAARQKFAGLLVARDSADEAALIKGVEVIPVDDLREAADFLNRKVKIEPHEELSTENPPGVYQVDFAEVRGQEHAKRALEVAAAGGHHCLMVGPPGAGKSMLAQRMPTIMPEMSRHEAIEVTKIHSIAGLGPKGRALMLERPLRSPHHTVSYVGLVGGGANPRPGEITLAHNGILFLDELPEFQRNAIESLRQPLESAEITITRAVSTMTFPCRFMLIAAMNPCPCGYLGDKIKSCNCTLGDIHRYQKKVSGPLLDRFDIRIEVPHLERAVLLGTGKAENSKDIKNRVLSARSRQEARYRVIGPDLLNSTIPAKELRKRMTIKPDANDFLEQIVDKFRLSGRSFDRLLRTSATIADLDESPAIRIEHLAEAIQYRQDTWKQAFAAM